MYLEDSGSLTSYFMLNTCPKRDKGISINNDRISANFQGHAINLSGKLLFTNQSRKLNVIVDCR